MADNNCRLAFRLDYRHIFSHWVADLNILRAAVLCLIRGPLRRGFALAFFPLPFTDRILAAISHGRSDYVASERLLKPLCLKKDEPKLQRQQEGSGKMARF